MDIRNRIPSPGFSPRVDDGNADMHRRLSASGIRLIEDRVLAQRQKIGTIFRENQRLAAIHVDLRQELAATKQEIERLTVSASAVKAERDAHVRNIRDRSVRLEADALSVKRFKEELEQLHAEIRELQAEHKHLVEQKMVIDADFVKIRPALQQFSELKAEMEFLKREEQRGRKAIEHEKEVHSNNMKQSDIMAKHLISLVREEEQLRSQLERVMAPAIPTPYPFPGYAANTVNPDPGYTGAPFFFPHVPPQVNYVPMPYYGVGPVPVPGCPPLFNNSIQ